MSKKLFLITAFSAALVFGGASASFAGEVTGNGKDLKPLNGKSLCAFSGLEDDEDLGGPGVVQSFGNHPVPGTGVAQGNLPNQPGPAAPGVACNPSENAHPN